MEITKEMQEEYIKNIGIKCPVCGKEEISTGSMDIDTSIVLQITCIECKSTWVEFYELTGIDSLEVPDESN